MTPAQLASKRDRSRIYREKLKADPIRLERKRERGRINQAAFYERNKDFLAFLERRRAYQRGYNRSDAGRAASARWRATENGRAYLRLKDAAKQARKAKSRSAIHEANRHAEEMRAALLADDLYAAADRCVPRSLPHFIRDDVISDLCLGALEGAFPAADMPRYVKPLIAQHRGAASKFGDKSLDDPAGEDGYTLGHQIGAYS